MKQLFTIGLGVLFTMWCTVQSLCYEIKGNVTGVKTGTVILTVKEPANLAFSDTVKITNGAFLLKGEIKDVVYASLHVCPTGMEPAGMYILLENCPIQISEDWATVIEEYGNRAFKGNHYKGGVNWNLSRKYDGQYDSISSQPKYAAYKKAATVLTALRDKKDDASKAKYEEVKKSMEADGDILRKESQAASIKLMCENNDLEFSAYIFNFICANMTLAEIEDVFNKFTPKVQNSFFAQEIKEEINSLKSVAPGQPAPDFTLKTPSGAMFTLSSAKGKYVLVDFWASWCGPCRAAVPQMKELYAKYKEKGFEIVGVANDSRNKDWLKAIDTDRSPWIHTIDEFPIKNRPARVSTLYGIHYLPSYFLIAPNGKIIGKMDESEVKVKLKEIFGE
ncbi:MAG: TlpA disulfide reductase family protein [Bacteroidales bacterium]